MLELEITWGWRLDPFYIVMALNFQGKFDFEGQSLICSGSDCLNCGLALVGASVYTVALLRCTFSVVFEMKAVKLMNIHLKQVES